MKKELILTKIKPVTIANLNRPILDFIVDHDQLPDQIVLTTEQMVTLTGLFINGENVGWKTYRGIPVRLVRP